ncbi:MAG: hypothetical protein E3J69_00580 [Anaerolineales bacterium]|nr:MAG: hypothetical protein E3J69_00580 [Anaerolineales bacterium]
MMTSTNEHTDVSGEVEAQFRAIRKTIGEQWSEILSATLLAVVAIGTAWSGYQSAQWGGIQSIKFSRASSLRVESTRASTLGGQLVTIDVILFEGWVDAYVAKNEDLMHFYEGRFRDEFNPAFEAWVATDPVNNPDAPSQPFLMEEYQVASMQEAEQLEEEASALFDEGEQANQTSDDYAFSTVLLATVLFFAGIATRFEWQPIRWVLLAIGIGLLIFGVYNLLSLPIA